MAPFIEHGRQEWGNDSSVNVSRPVEIELERTQWVPLQNRPGSLSPVEIEVERAQWAPVADQNVLPPVVAPRDARWNNFMAMQEVYSIREFRGVDLRNPFFIHDGAAMDAVNIDGMRYPAL